MFILSYIFLFVFILLHTFIIRYFPVKKSFSLRNLVRAYALILPLFPLMIIWNSADLDGIVRILLTVIFISLIVITGRSLIKKR